MSLLEVKGLNSYYGDSHILFDVALEVQPHEVVALLGRNGAGKSTTFKSLMGMVKPRSGSIKFDGHELVGRAPHEIAQVGLQLVPEERRIFGSLDVEENIILAGLSAKNKWSLDRIYDLFPRLGQRKRSSGTALSGGEQQMLAIARALVRDIKLLLLDEPYEGLAPVIVDEIEKTLNIIKSQGITTVLVEQNALRALALADRAVILDTGTVVFDGTAQEVLENEALRHEYLAI